MPKILIVDDSETLRSQLRKSLETASYQVIEAFDGQNGLEVIEQNKDIKLILCDVNMPRLDGLSMCQKVHVSLPKLPIVMLTTEANPEMKAKGKEAGVIAWVTKPYDEAKLLQAVEKILKMTQ